MTRTHASLIALTLAAFTAGHALAADDAAVGKTREQVKAELAEAIRTGDIVANGDSGKKLNELFPSRYEAQRATGAKTREQVKAELNDAIRTGDLVAGGDSGKKLNELFPHSYPRTH